MTALCLACVLGGAAPAFAEGQTVAQGPGPLGGFGSSGYSKGTPWGATGGARSGAPADSGDKRTPSAATRPAQGGAKQDGKPAKKPARGGDKRSGVEDEAATALANAPQMDQPSSADGASAAQNVNAPGAESASRRVARAPLPPVRPADLTEAVAEAAATSGQPTAPAQAAEAPAEPVEAHAQPALHLAMHAPLPPVRPRELAHADEPAAHDAPVAQQAAAVEVASGQTAEAPRRSGGFDLFKFLAGKPQNEAPPQDMAAGPIQDEPRHGRRQARGAARDAVARAHVAPLIAQYARAHGVPVALADAVVRVESRYNPSARNGPYMGLMQIHVNTARSMGYAGSAQGLLDPDTNLRYGVKYLATAYRLAGGDTCRTIMKYQGGHRTERLSAHAARYCSRVRTMMASN